MPITRSFGNPVTSEARKVISSSGLLTTITMESGEVSRTWPATPRMMPAFFSRRSMRVMPGCLGSPAVITTTSDPAVSP
jgi:hypothetical protein